MLVRVRRIRLWCVCLPVQHLSRRPMILRSDAMEMVFDVSIMACEAAVDYCYYTPEEVDSTTRVP